MGRYSVALSLIAVPMLGILALPPPPAASAQEATPAVELSSLSPVVTNPFFPLASLRSTVLEGEEEDPETGGTIETRVELTVLPETTTVAGVEVTVAEVKEYEDGELVEATLDYYAQAADGTVYYLGERVDMYEEGTVVGHEGTWLAGEGANQPGVYMPAHPEVGHVFEQERAPGVAEDRSTVLAVEQSIVTPAGEFSGCLHVEDVAPVEGTTGEKYYCPGSASLGRRSKAAPSIWSLSKARLCPRRQLADPLPREPIRMRSAPGSWCPRCRFAHESERLSVIPMPFPIREEALR